VDTLHAHDTGDATCDTERRRLEAVVVARLDERIAQLQRVRRNASGCLDDCRVGCCRLVGEGKLSAGRAT
jgi:hypothetical protein